MDHPVLQFVPLLIILVFVVGLVWITGTIMKKTGRSRSWGVLWFIPLINLGLLAWLAYSEWPIEAENRRLRESLQMLQQIPR